MKSGPYPAWRKTLVLYMGTRETMSGEESISHRNKKAPLYTLLFTLLEEYFEDELEEYMDGTYRLGNVESCQW